MLPLKLGLSRLRRVVTLFAVPSLITPYQQSILAQSPLHSLPHQRLESTQFAHEARSCRAACRSSFAVPRPLPFISPRYQVPLPIRHEDPYLGIVVVKNEDTRCSTATVMDPGSDPHRPAGNQQTEIEDALSSSSASGTHFLSFGEST